VRPKFRFSRLHLIPQISSIVFLLLCLVCLGGNALPVRAQTVIGTPAVGEGPGALAVNPVTNEVYVANVDAGTVSVIDGATNTVVGPPVPVGATPIAVAVNPLTNTVYVANEDSSNVTVIDGATNTVVGLPVMVGANPIAVVVNPVTNTVYVANLGTGNSPGIVTVINGATNRVTATVTVGS
jgi:YVTN family beta-propeller protein